MQQYLEAWNMAKDPTTPNLHNKEQEDNKYNFKQFWKKFKRNLN